MRPVLRLLQGVRADAQRAWPRERSVASAPCTAFRPNSDGARMWARAQVSTELDWHDREIRFDVKLEHLELRRGEVCVRLIERRPLAFKPCVLNDRGAR